MSLRSLVRLGKDAMQANLMRPELPFKLTLAITYWCNHRCKICHIWKLQPAGELSAEEIWRFFRQTHGFSWVDLTGGEIFVRQDLRQIFHAVLEHCQRLAVLHFPTNGMFPEQAEAEIRYLLRQTNAKLIVTVSLDGPPELHDKLRGVEGAFQMAVETYRRSADSGAETYFGYTFSPGNLHAFGETIDSLAKEIPGIGPRDIHVNTQNVSGHYFQNSHLRPLAGPELDRALEEVLRLRGMPRTMTEGMEWAFLHLARRYARTGRQPIPCQAWHSSCFVDPWGNVFPCTIYGRKIGNLRESDYDLGRIWRNGATRDVRQTIRRGKCPNCWTPCEAYPTLLTPLASWIQ